MPTDMPLPRENLSHPRRSATERPESQPVASEQSFPALEARDPRTHAALCYALPFVPGLYLLWHERRDRFIRLHAAQSVVFFTLAALLQVSLFVLVIVLGNVLSGGWLATAIGLTFWGLFLVIGVGGLLLWLRLLNDCVHGRLRRRPLLTSLALRLETRALRFTRSASAAYHAPRNTPQS